MHGTSIRLISYNATRMPDGTFLRSSLFSRGFLFCPFLPSASSPRVSQKMRNGFRNLCELALQNDDFARPADLQAEADCRGNTRLLHADRWSGSHVERWSG
jgi:hypothetical protein